MTFKEYIDNCTWEDLKATQGVKDFMQYSLADLKCLKPKYTDDTEKYTIHFEENTPDEGDSDEMFVKYDAFVKETGCEHRIGVFESGWDEMLSLEVCIEEGIAPTPNDIVAAVIWDLTWMGPTSAECEKAWEKKLKEWDDAEKNGDFVDIEIDLEDVSESLEEKTD
jgi:hypothetical protein